MSQLAEIGTIVGALANGAGDIMKIAKKPQTGAPQSQSGTPSLGGMGNKLSLSDTLSGGSTGLGSLTSGSAGISAPTKPAMTGMPTMGYQPRRF